MDKFLPDNIDDFFSEHFQNYGEEPDEKIWSVIDKRLSEEENNKPYFSAWKVLTAATVIAVCLLLPFLLINPYHKNKSSEIVTGNIKPRHQVFVQNKNVIVASTQTKHAKVISFNQTNTKNISLPYPLAQHNYSIIKMPATNNLKDVNNDENLQQPNQLTTQHLITDSITLKDKTNEEKAASVAIKLPKKHSISINPFFSFDHISGRFIEQYEFDNDDKDVYGKREKPDVSFTGGLLAGYKLNNKFSILSGFSMSASALSISATAVKALKDNNGVYKFKLATSYGFAEIVKSGITPEAGDSLLISSAEMKFNYITFPLLLSYNINNKKIALSVHTGIAFNSITSDNVSAEYEALGNDETESIKKVEGIRKSFFTINSGVEAKYHVGKNIDVGLSPEVRYGINSINKGTPVKTYPINYGLALHLSIHL